jgi:transposase
VLGDRAAMRTVAVHLFALSFGAVALAFAISIWVVGVRIQTPVFVVVLGVLVFGKAGRRWLAELKLPDDEREAVTAGLRQVDFFTVEIDALDRAIANHASNSVDVGRLMSVPGVSVITATTFTSAIGGIRRFRSPGHLVGYPGLDPTVRQSGSEPTRCGRISKRGPSAVRQTLTEAALIAIRTPGPMRAFHERIRSRRGHQVATVAVARKLAVLFGTYSPATRTTPMAARC